MDSENKESATKKKMGSQRSSCAAEIIEDDLGDAVGGKASMKNIETVDFICPYCGQTIKVRDARDASRHCNQDCPNSPYK